MRQVRLKDHEGSKVFVFQHGTMFFYIFARADDKGNVQQYMQWGEHQPPILRQILSWFGYAAHNEEEIYAIADAYVGHAMRSIDHLIDPTSTHCDHDVKISGENSALCAVCNTSGDRI